MKFNMEHFGDEEAPQAQILEYYLTQRKAEYTSNEQVQNLPTHKNIQKIPWVNLFTWFGLRACFITQILCFKYA